MLNEFKAILAEENLELGHVPVIAGCGAGMASGVVILSDLSHEPTTRILAAVVAAVCWLVFCKVARWI